MLQSIDRVQALEAEFFPVLAGELGSSMEAAQRFQQRLDSFMPEFEVITPAHWRLDTTIYATSPEPNTIAGCQCCWVVKVFYCLYSSRFLFMLGAISSA